MKGGDIAPAGMWWVYRQIITGGAIRRGNKKMGVTIGGEEINRRGGNKHLTLTCRHVVGANRAQIGINPAYKPPGPEG